MRCEFCKTRMPRQASRCEGCGASNPKHAAVSVPTVGFDVQQSPKKAQPSAKQPSMFSHVKETMKRMDQPLHKRQIPPVEAVPSGWDRLKPYNFAMFAAKNNDTKLLHYVLLGGGVLCTAIGILTITWGIGIFFLALSVAILVCSIQSLYRNAAIQRIMRDYHVNEAAFEDFERERISSKAHSVENITLTKHWIFCAKQVGLFPLEQIRWAERKIHSNKYSYYRYARLHFNNGDSVNVARFGSKIEVIEFLELLKQHNPNIKIM